MQQLCLKFIGTNCLSKLYFPMKLSVEHEWGKTALDRVKDYKDFAVFLNVSSSRQDSS
jgi:hypothetical protein